MASMLHNNTPAPPPSADLIIRGGALVRESGVATADVVVADGSIVEIGPDLSRRALEEIDARGLHLFPGAIDPHVHFNEPGRTEWEGFATGSAALAAGSGTCFFDMPLNSSPPTLDGESFDAKLAAAARSSYCDFALWGGLTPNSLERMEELAERGVIGFKAFMCNSGMDDFPRADDWTLEQGMRIAAKLKLPVAVHAENQEMVAGKMRWMRSRLPQLTARDWVHTREPLAEAEAIQRAALLASNAGCALHIVHVSNRYCVELAHSWKQMLKEGVSIETCPHYLFLSDDDVRKLGPIAKCAPPIRETPHGDQLWRCVADGLVDVIASDHSPAVPTMKEGDFFEAWGGIAGVQSTRAVLLTRQPAVPLELVARLTSQNIARRFKLPRKGSLEVGLDADVALVDLAEEYELTREMLGDRNRLSPYVGRRFRGRLRRTMLRGRTIFLDGRTVGEPEGRLIRPTR